MGEQTAIGWCDHTFNAWIGCTEVGPECDHCYARILAARWGWATWGPDTPRRDQSPDYWRKPGSWNRAAIAVGIRRSVFCESMGDLFEDRRDLDVRRLWLWARIETTPVE